MWFDLRGQARYLMISDHPGSRYSARSIRFIIELLCVWYSKWNCKDRDTVTCCYASLCSFLVHTHTHTCAHTYASIQAPAAAHSHLLLRLSLLVTFCEALNAATLVTLLCEMYTHSCVWSSEELHTHACMMYMCLYYMHIFVFHTRRHRIESCLLCAWMRCANKGS